MKPTEIKLSVALVTRNRPESLTRCLESWRSQTVSPFEIVISDDSDEAYQCEIQQLAKQYHCVYISGPKRGLYANRNHSSLACRGTHILSADDDHVHPSDYVEQVLKVIKNDPNRVWIFSERNFDEPEAPLLCPAELGMRGGGCPPENPGNCAAIADGSSVYPRQIFDAGLRYDDTYPFGCLWYLWGHFLVKNNWRISFSDATHIWHHCLRTERERDRQWLQREMECNFYVNFVYNLWLNPSLQGIFWALLGVGRRLILPATIPGYKVKSRLQLTQALRLIYRAWHSRDRYQKRFVKIDSTQALVSQ